MINVGDYGVIFKEQSGTTWTRYLCDPDTGIMTEDNPTFTDPGDLGTLTVASMTLVQVREDPENYVSGSYPDIYMIDTGNNDYFIKVTYNSGDNTISVDSSVAIDSTYHVTMTPKHVDVGRQHFVVMSPIDCSADESTGSEIYYPSVRTYTFSTATWSCDDVEASETSTSAWALDGTRRRLYGDDYEILSKKQDL